MRAAVGDRLHIHGRAVGDPERTVTIIEVRGKDGSPPYLVRQEDGHEKLVFPGADTSVEHAEGTGST